MSPANLPSQFIRIDPGRDTTLALAGGTHLVIPAGAIKSRNPQVRLEIKEAVTMQQMVLAGLVTMSDGKLLGSGGMLYVAPAEGEEARLEKPIRARIPARLANEKMQVFKGEMDGSRINWTDPKPLAAVTASPRLERGKMLFAGSCASCHDPAKSATGPVLFNALQRWGSKKRMYDFVRNSSRMIASGDVYANCVYNAWNKTAMTAFPTLSNEELDDIFAYADREGESAGLDKDAYKAGTADACLAIVERYRELSKMAVTNRAAFVQLNQEFPPPPVVREDIPWDSVGRVDSFLQLVAPSDEYADYYNIEVNTFGWYNVDIFLKELPGTEPSTLRVSVERPDKVKVKVMLVVPSVKAFAEAGLLEDGIAYGFYERNGNIPLPQGVQAYIFGIGEASDKEQLYFGSLAFTTAGEQRLDLRLEPSDKDRMMAAINAFRFDNVAVKIARDTTLDQARQHQQELEELREELMRTCPCFLPVPVSESDSSSI